MIAASVFWIVLATRSCATIIDDVRLVGGHSATQGRVEVKVRGMWGTICDHLWNRNDAVVTCRSVGLRGGVAKTGAFFGQGSGPIHLKAVVCAGNEASLASCTCGQERSQCRHSDDVSVVCVLPISAVTQYVYPPFHFSDSLPSFNTEGVKKKQQHQHIVNVAHGLTKDTISDFDSGPVNMRPYKHSKHREISRSWSTNSGPSSATQRSVFLGYITADFSPGPAPGETSFKTNITKPSHTRHKTNITNPSYTRHNATNNHVQTAPHHSTHSSADEEQGTNWNWLPKHSVFKRQVESTTFPNSTTQKTPQTNKTTPRHSRINTKTNKQTTKKPAAKAYSDSPSALLITGLVIGALAVAALIITGAWYYQQEPKKDKEREAVKKGLENLNMSPSKSILRPKSSYGETVRPDLGKDNTLEENTDRNAESEVDFNVLVGITPPSWSRASSDATPSTSTGERSGSTIDSQPPINRESFSEMYLKSKL